MDYLTYLETRVVTGLSAVWEGADYHGTTTVHKRPPHVQFPEWESNLLFQCLNNLPHGGGWYFTDPQGVRFCRRHNRQNFR